MVESVETRCYNLHATDQAPREVSAHKRLGTKSERSSRRTRRSAHQPKTGSAKSSRWFYGGTAYIFAQEARKDRIHVSIGPRWSRSLAAATLDVLERVQGQPQELWTQQCRFPHRDDEVMDEASGPRASVCWQFVAHHTSHECRTLELKSELGMTSLAGTRAGQLPCLVQRSHTLVC